MEWTPAAEAEAELCLPEDMMSHKSRHPQSFGSQSIS